MKFLKQGLSLAILGAGLAAVPLSQAMTTTANAAPAAPSIVQKLRSAADGTVSLSEDASTGKLSFARVSGAGADLLPGVAGGDAAAATAKAKSYLDTYGAAFGAAKGTLAQTKVDADSVGWTISYEQRYLGVPVFGSGLKAHVDTDGDLTSVNGFAVPDLDLSTKPRISAADAGARAVRMVKADPPTAEDGGAPADTTGLAAGAVKLVVYRTGFLKGDTGANVLAWTVEVTNKANVRDMVILDATTGKPVNRYSLANDALDRQLQEATGTAAAPVLTTVWNEGDPFPGNLNVDQQNLVNSSGESYWMYDTAFGRDSYDGAGAKRITVNNDPRISCPNANWNGVTTNYCNGVTSDDVVAHEWGHAYTEYTSGLIYQYQPGALNESYSDVWGETLDQINGREDEGEVFDTKRPDGQCDPTAGPKLQFTITSPASAAGPCTPVAASGANAPVFTTTPVNATVIVATDPSDSAGTSTTDGCTAFTNAAAVAGNWAYMDRGTCTFAVKFQNAKNAGATGVVIGNNAAGLPPAIANATDIYGVAVTQADGTRIKGAGGPVGVRVQAEDTSTRVDSTRWLIGEKATAFGGAIRDMWTPTCYGNPGKVSDAEYNCDPNNLDSGGVHGNSGVPNHLYALAVDGGTSNGQTLTGMGLDKAANIWWRAQTSYLVPSSNFSAASDAFETSCTDLIGKTINHLDTTPNAAPVAAPSITADDCANLTKAIAATEMRKPVTQCNFQPVLAAGNPSPCGDGFTTQTVFSEDFEDGLTDWTPTFAVGTGGANLGFPWKATSEAPGNHPGGVAYGPAPDEGDCSGNGTTDFSSSDAITSAAITIPASGYVSPRLTFDHYVATEAGFDGGNVKISRNGGAFTAVTAAAYTFNKPKALTTTGGGSTSPLAGQPGFTGTDGGEVTGSWGTSVIDLAAAGVQPGDTVKIRYDIGRDGCGGIDGWYVDNVKLTVCRTAVALTATHTPEPVAFGAPSTIVVEATSTGGTPTGTVTVAEGATTLATGTLGADGKASIPLPTTLSAGVHTLTVSLPESATLGAASTTVTATVLADPTTTTAVHAPQPVTYGQAHTVTATVTAAGGGTPTGDVTVTEGTTPVASGTLTAGSATIALPTTLAVGTHTLTVTYVGAGNFATSSTTVTTTVVAIVSTTTAVHAPEPVAYGAPHAVTATVAAASGAAPTGTVTLTEGATVLGTGTLSGGSASIPLPTTLSVGTHTLTVSYGGSSTVAASSTTLRATVTTVATTLTATHAPEPVEQGAASSVTATVTAADGSTPTGAVTLSEGTTNLGVAALTAGKASIAVPTTLSVGVHTLTVTYPGSSTFAPATTTVKVTVTAKPTPPAPVPGPVASSTKVKAPASVRKGSTFKAKVTTSAAGAVPSGAVTIKAGGKTLGTGTMVGGKVKIKVKTSSLKLGKVTFKATYAGSSTVAASKTKFTVTVKR